LNAFETISAAAQKVGYRQEALVRNYAFADVLTATATTRCVELAAFTQTPPSYRSAALAVVTSDDQSGLDARELVQQYRALGAPLLFVVAGDAVTLWQVRGGTPPRILERLTISELPALFERNSDAWRPDAIHRAKSIGAVETGYQLDFVDAGLLPAIESELHVKLDRLLVDALAAATNARRSGDGVDTRLIFRMVFRLLAAKVLQDRHSSWAKKWNPDDLPSVLQNIESYYSLDKMPILGQQQLPLAANAVWDTLRNGISFSNISADDLAFVYENTLITPETRKLFGTHSTPRQVAEYIVQRLELHHHKPESLRIYEPFAGAGIFLVSALRHLRDLLPVTLTDQQRHEFLTARISGGEIEPFACEVAKLSLILADYPNHNGWKIEELDLFEGDLLKERLRSNNVILCNPPFESFSKKEKADYKIAQTVNSKPMAVLDAALDAHPLCLGFVLPRPFIVEGQFIEQRKRIEKLYENVEIVELPDRIFNASTIEAALLIARNKRKINSSKITLRSTEIFDRDRLRFLKRGDVTAQRQVLRDVDDNLGDLWIPPLSELWHYLCDYPKLNSIFDIHLGARWKYDQALAVSPVKKKGFVPGLFNAEDVRQFFIPKLSFIDLDPAHLTHALGRDWLSPKIIANAVRLSRGPWKLAATVDRQGLGFSQQLLGLWPKSTDIALEDYAAVLNSPIANAFLSTRYPAHRFRIASFGELPVPPSLPGRTREFVLEYMELASSSEIFQNREKHLIELLDAIDAAVLDAYDLPLRLERELLNLLHDVKRPVAHPWTNWDERHSMPGLHLGEKLAGRYQPYGGWVVKVFDALPEEEASVLRIFGNGDS